MMTFATISIWGLCDDLGAQARNPRDDRIVRLGPATAVLPGFEPPEPVLEPDFGLLARAQGPDLGGRNRVGRIIQAAKACPREAHLGRIEQPGQGHLHGHAAIAKRLGDALDVVVCRGEHGNVAEGDRPGMFRSGLAHQAPGMHELGDRERQRVRPVRHPAPRREGPSHERWRVVRLRPNWRELDQLARHAVAVEGLTEYGVEVANDRRTGTPGRIEHGAAAATGDERLERFPDKLGIASPEAEDGLLHVTDKDHLPGDLRDLHEEGQLHRVGVLELVDEQQLDVLAESLENRRIVEGP